MSKPKTTNQGSKTPNTDPSEEAGSDHIEVTVTAQTAAQRATLARVSRFLVNIQSRTLGRKAARAGYRTKAHAEGWKLYNKAGGADRPLEHWFGEQALTGDAEGIASTGPVSCDICAPSAGCANPPLCQHPDAFRPEQTLSAWRTCEATVRHVPCLERTRSGEYILPPAPDL